MSDLDVSELITVTRAIEILDATPASPRIVQCPLSEAQGLQLAEDLRADRDYPPFDRSLMDGFAVRGEDLKTLPAELSVIGEVAAGRVGMHPLQAGQAIAIMTGAPIPPGADRVVPVEATTEISPGRVRVNEAPPARYISPQGSDCPQGRVVLRRGTILEAAQIAAAATVGAATVPVFARPRVALLATGDELVPVDQTPGPGQIRNSNNLMLAALLRSYGCDVTDLGVARDEPALIRTQIEAGQRSDVVFVTGGMSMGRYDYVPRILQEMNYALRITKLRIKPGKPFVFATRRIDAGNDQKLHYVFGLPGNPVSSFVCAHRLASRLLQRLAGTAVRERWFEGFLRGRVPANGPREFYLPVIRTGWMVLPLEWRGSADVFTLAAANALLVREPDAPPLAHGEVRVLEIGP